MGFHIPILTFELGDIGLTPRRRIEATNLYDLVLMFPEKPGSQYWIHPDVNGEYSFSNEMLQFDRPYQVFYDGEHKVLEAFYDEHGLILNILTDKQTNLFLDVTANECVIKAHGPLCIDGKMRLKSALAISAKALCFLDAIDFEGAITLTAQQGVGLLAPLRAKQLNITAAYLYQSADLAISQYDLSVQAFQQIKGSKTHIGSLRLVSEQCEIVGEFSVQESCFLAANNLLIGDNKSVTRIELPADHHIHVVNSVTRGQSSTVVGREFEATTQGSKENAQWIVDEAFFVDKRASLVFHNTRFAANRIENRGDWSLNHCLLAIQLTNIRGGSFVLSHTDLVGDKIYAFSGAMTVDNHSRIGLTQSLIIDESVHFVMKKSEVHAQHKILLFGTIIMSRANVHAESFRAYQTVTLKKTQVTSKLFFELQGDLKLNKVAIQSQTVLFAGVLDIDDVTLNATTVDYQSQQGYVVKNFVNADSISIDGSESKGNMTIVDGRLVFNTISVKQYVVVQNTSLVGVEDANICHNIEGLLSLEQSQFISQNQLQSLIGSHLELCEYSHILSGRIDSKGDISAQDSAIYCDSLMQDGGSISAKSSKVHVNKTLSAQNTELNLDSGSMVSASNVILSQGNNMRLKGVSILAAREQVIIGADTALQSHDSTSYARKFSVLGRAELCASLLSAQELLIYDQFDAQDKTIIQVDERISLAKTAQMQLSSSHMTARNIETFGVLDVIKSSIHAEETISLWSTSNTSIQDSTSVVAEDALLRGQLIIKKKIDEDDETLSTITAKPIIQIKKQMDISSLGCITANEDLFIDAEEINQSGTIELTGNFCAKGRQFTNVGSVIAPSIYLGFDDAVINHGLFSAKSMTVHSNFMNVLGQVYARETLSCSGFVSLNIGLVVANNYVNDSFVSLNAGLIAPNLSADLKYIFSLNNLAMVAKTAAIMWMPAHASGIQLFSMIPGFFSTAANLYHLSNQLDWETLKNMRWHEYMPILCQIKNACMFGRGLFTSAGSFGSEFSAWDSSFTKMTHDPSAWASDWRTTFQSTDWKEMGLRTAGAFGGSYTDTSLLHVNLGASVAANTSKTNVVHLNFGAEQSFFSHNINTYTLYNTGYSAGRESSFSATSINNSGSLVGASQFTLRANRVDNYKKGTIKGAQANVAIDELHQDGILSIENGQLKIKHFTDSSDAHTQLTSVALSGNTLIQDGEFKLKDVYIHEEESVATGIHSKGTTDNVSIETNVFTHMGQLDYEHTLTVKAETVILAKGSILSGQTTDEDKLFVPKQMTTGEVNLAEDSKPQSSGDNTEKQDPKEIEKEFKPDHTLSILAQKVTLDGQLAGGDYTQIRGRGTDTTNTDGTNEADSCDEVIIGDSASIDLKYGSIDAKKSNISGNTVLDSFRINIKENVVNQDGVFKLTHSNFTGDVLDSSGLLILDYTHVDIASTHLAKDAHEQLIDSNLYSKQILDESQLSYQGQVGIVTDDYQHTGHVQKEPQPEGSESKNLFYVQSKTGRLDGSGDIDNGYYNIEHMGDGTAFVVGRGKYSLYMTSESLSFVTQDSFHLADTIERDCDISVQASDILFGISYYRPHDLTLIATVGDVVLTGAIQSSNLYAKSARNLLSNNSIGTTSTLSFEAEGEYYNYGGLLNSDVVAVKAAEIKNFTQGSVAASQGTRLPMGGSGVINARSKLFLEATKGNIENHGGIMRAGDYAQLLAAGNVVNSCNERSYQGQYDTLKEFSGGLISGGDGTLTDGIGLYVKAQGYVISDASDFVSNGSNYIEGVQGLSFTARQHTYVSLDRTDKKWYGKKAHVVETSTTVKGSVVHSNNGRNIIQSGEGGFTSVATRFSSPGGTDVYAKGNVQLFSLNAQNHRFESHSSFWGLSKKDRDYIYESSTPTLFLDNGTTRICSAEGNVDARGAYFIGAGDLSIKAKGRIQFGVDILAHELHEKMRAFHLKTPGLAAWDSYKQGGSLWDMATAEDATLAKLDFLSKSHNAAELLASSSSLGIDLANTTNNIMRGLGRDGLTNELMARYGLGGAGGFAPSLTLSMTESKTTSRFQTQAQGGVDRGGNVRLEAGEGIDLENGVRVHAGGNLEINAPEVIAHAVALKSSVKQTTQSENIGATLMGQVQQVGVSYSRTENSSIHYINAELSAGGNMLLHHQDQAMERLELDGATLSAGSLDATIHQLIIRDKQDVSQTETKSFSVSTSGQFSVYDSNGFDKATQQRSAIHVTDGVNTNDHHVEVDETYMEGGTIITEGENHFTTYRLVSITLQDERQYSGVGISGNINDFNRLIGGRSTNVPGEQTFATVAVMFDHIDYSATQTAVIYGEKGTTLDINTLQGEIHTESADGKSIQHDDSIHLQLDIPITNRDYLDKRAENMEAGEAKLSEFFKPKPHQEEPVAFERPEPIRPVEDNAEEKDDEDAEDKKDKHPKRKKDDYPGTGRKDKVKTETELSHEVTQEVVDGALKHLKFDSPKAERDFNKTVENAQHEKATTGKVSHKTEEALKRQITTALIKTLKAGTEQGWGRFVEKLGPDYNQKLIKLLSNSDTFSQAGVKTYLGTKGALITFAFNLALSSLDDEVAKGDVLKHSATATVVDFSFGVVLEYGLERLAMGEAVGPIGWGLVVLDVVDSFYSPEQINKLIEHGISNLYEAQSLYRDGHPLAGWAVERAAADKIGAAARAQCGHIIAEMMKPVIAKVESIFDKPVQQPSIKPTSPTSNQKFFKPDVVQASEFEEKRTRERTVSW